MQNDEASAWVGTGWGIAHIASTVKDRGSRDLWVNGKASVRLRTSAGEGDRGLTCGMTGSTWMSFVASDRERQYLWVIPA